MSEWPPSDQDSYSILRRTPASSIGTMQYCPIDKENLETDLDTNHIDIGKITYCDVVMPDGIQKNAPITINNSETTTNSSGKGWIREGTVCGVEKLHLQRILNQLYDDTDILREPQEWESTMVNNNSLEGTRKWGLMNPQKAAWLRSQTRTMQCLYYDTTSTISVLQALQNTDIKSSWYYQMAGIAITVLQSGQNDAYQLIKQGMDVSQNITNSKNGTRESADKILTGMQITAENTKRALRAVHQLLQMYPPHEESWDTREEGRETVKPQSQKTGVAIPETT